MHKHFGSMGEAFYQFVRGIDDRPVQTEGEAKSISTETTFATDIPVREFEHLRAVLLDQTDQVARRLRRHGLLARTVNLKVRSGDFTTLTRSVTLAAAVDRTDEFWTAAAGLFETWARRRPFAVRLIGIGVSSLVPPAGQQLTLFDQAEAERRRQLDRAVDEICDKFGKRAIGRGLLKRDEE
jgi:DNA polymerase-4